MKYIPWYISRAQHRFLSSWRSRINVLKIRLCTYMLAPSSEPSRSQFLTRFCALNTLGRDDVHHLVLCLLVARHPARLSRLCGGLSRARVVSQRRLLFSFFVKVSQSLNRRYRYIGSYLWLSSYNQIKNLKIVLGTY